jgi:hypothetical protein
VWSWLCFGCIDWVALGSLATLLAVLVALFGEQLWRRWNRPVLKAYVRKNDSGCFYKTKVWLPGTAQVSEAYYFRLWVVNDGRGPAEDVQVFVSRLSRKDDSGDFRPVKEFLPMGLLWTHSQPPSTSLPRLHPDMGHHCELGTVPKHNTAFELLVEVKAFTGWHRLASGTYRLQLRLACASGSPKVQTVEVHFDGKWHDDEAAMFRDGVAVRLVT